MSIFKTTRESKPDLTFELARKWSRTFDVPVTSVMSIVDIESQHNPHKINPARIDKGGAWGLGQQMADEAEYKVELIKKKYLPQFPKLKPVLRKWKGKPEDLLDPELNIVLTAWQLGRLHRIFGDFPTVAAAYHQGEGAVKTRLAEDKPAVSRLQPKGMAYVASATAAQEKYMSLPMLMAIAD